MGTFLSLLLKFGSGLGRQILISLGIGITSGAVVMQLFNYFLAKIQAQAGFIGAGASLFGLAGLDTALSIIIGACFVRASLSVMGVTFGKLAK